MAALPDPQQEADFQRFLRRVDDISECGSGVGETDGRGKGKWKTPRSPLPYRVSTGRLVQGLSSADSAVRDAAIAETDRRLRERQGSEQSAAAADRTVINTRDPVRVCGPAFCTWCSFASCQSNILPIY